MFKREFPQGSIIGYIWMVFTLLLVALLSTTVSTEKARFDNYKVYRVMPNTSEQVQLLQELEIGASGLDFWTSPGRVNASVDIMVPPHSLPEFNEIAGNLHLRTELLIQDVQRLIDNERPRSSRRTDFDWLDYHPLEKVNAWLDAQVKKYPNIVSSIIGGSTYEGRQIRGVKVSYKEGNPGIFIESGTHGREWITVATATHILNELLTSQDPAIRNVAENFDWYVFPSTNPDGYVFSHTTNRMWRKTRSPGEPCMGTDPNRNYDYHWMDAGASNNPCSEAYAGTKVFSEVETRSLSEFVKSIASKLRVYFTFHSFSQFLMTPFGLNYELPDNYQVLLQIGLKSAEAIAKRYGTTYTVGTRYSIAYPASGGSLDWAKKTLNITYTFEWELRDKGQHAFILPADQIIPTALETLDGIVSILEDVQALEKEKN